MCELLKGGTERRTGGGWMETVGAGGLRMGSVVRQSVPKEGGGGSQKHWRGFCRSNPMNMYGPLFTWSKDGPPGN